MGQKTKRVLHWTPRVLGIAFAAFLSLFAADVFDTPLDFGQRMLALSMHLIPAAIVLAALAVVWRHEWAGAIIFPLLALLHLAIMWGRLGWPGYVAIEAPLFILGILFALDWRNRTATSRRAQ